MINEKMALKIYPKNQKEIRIGPTVWYDLNYINWNEEEKIITVKFALSIDVFNIVLSLIKNPKLSLDLWVSNSYLTFWLDKKTDITHLGDTQLLRFKVQNCAWGDKQWFAPECILQFKYTDKQEESLIAYEQNIERNYLDMSSPLRGYWQTSLLYDNKIMFDDFSIEVNTDDNFFPIEFMCSKNFENEDLRNKIFNYFESNNKDLKLIFSIKTELQNSSLIINDCYLDFSFKNKDIGNYQGVHNNLVLYGGGTKQSGININEDSIEDRTSLESYISNKKYAANIHRDKNGILAFEL